MLPCWQPARTLNGRAYDPFAAATVREGDVALEAVGRDAAMPWKTDGRRWHTAECTPATARPAAGKAMLDWLDEENLTHSAIAWADTDWSERSVVVIAAPE